MKFATDFKVLSIACVIITLALASCIAYDLNGQSFDFSDSHLVLVVSDSMDGNVVEYDIDSFPSDTLVMVQELADYEKGFLREGDVIAYHNDGMLSVHRVIKVDDGYVYVHGDNNHSTEMIGVSDVEGRVIGASHALGEIATFIGGNVFLFLAVGFAICSVPIVLRVYTAPRSQKCLGAPSRALTVVALLAVVAMVFVGVGAAYTASTENTNNSVSSEYTVLEQFNYSFTSQDGLRIDTVTTEAGTVYQLRDVVPLIEIDGVLYYGHEIGQDRLTAYVVGGSQTDLEVSVSTTDIGGGTGFTKFDGYQEWRYVLKVEANRFVVLIDSDYNPPLSGINVVKVESEGCTLISGAVAGSTSYTGEWKVWGNTLPDNYTVSNDDVCTIDGNKFIVLVDDDVALGNYNIVKIKSTQQTSELVVGKSLGEGINGSWKPWGGSQTDSYKVSDNDAYPKNVAQYAYYDGTATGEDVQWKILNPDSIEYLTGKSAGNQSTPGDSIPGTWMVWGQGDVTSDYKVKDADKHGDENFILLVDPNCRFTGLTVVKITANGVIEYDTNMNAGDTISGSWKLWNATTKNDYTVSASDAKNGFIVLTKNGLSFSGYTVIEVKNRLDIVKDVTYTTTLYFAGPGKDPKALYRSAASTVRTSSDIIVSPVWAPADEDKSWRITLKSNTEAGGVGEDRYIYISKNAGLIIGENTFTNTDPQMKFIGWKDTELGKTYPPWYEFGEADHNRTFVAQWSKTNVIEVTVNPNNNSDQSYHYYVQSGGVFALPVCKIQSNPVTGKTFVKWEVSTTVGGTTTGYTDYTQPFDVIESLTEDITLTAQWDTVAGSHTVVMEGLINRVPTKLVASTGTDGRFTLPYCFFEPTYELNDSDFKGWMFMGFWVYKTEQTSIVAQTYTLPNGQNNYIIKDGTIEFMYDSSEGSA